VWRGSIAGNSANKITLMFVVNVCRRATTISA
jgi:hypothetical protein